MWTECHAGRGGNDIASTLYQMLEKLCEENTTITRITTWSDSCVPQTRNSYTAAAILHFLSTHNNIECVAMKYSLPVHSCIQEVDIVHSQREKCFSIAEFHSPLTLKRLGLKANRKKPFLVIHPERKISYIAYQRIFTKEKISFGKPSQDDCDLCAKYKSHCEENSSCDHDSLSSEMCQLGKVHKADASEARDNYRGDGTAIFAADTSTQTDSQRAFFVSRLVTFNETFASLNNTTDYVVLWHEGIAGRCA